MSSSSSSIHSSHAGSLLPAVRGERKNLTLSKIIRVALATLGTIASYAFLPPAGAAIVSSVIILATILSFFEAEPDTTAHRRPWHRRFVTVGDYVLPTRWSFFRAPRRFFSAGGVTTPSPFTRDHRIVLLDNNEWVEMGRPSFDHWASMGSPTFATWRTANPTPRRSAVRDSASASAPRAPVGTGGVTPSVATPAVPRRRLSSYVPTSLWSSGSSRTTTRPTEPASAPRAPVGTGELTPSSTPRETSPSTSSSIGSSFPTSTSSGRRSERAAARTSLDSSRPPSFHESFSSSPSSSFSPSFPPSAPTPTHVRLDSSMSGPRVPVGGRR